MIFNIEKFLDLTSYEQSRSSRRKGAGGRRFDICLMNPPYDGNTHLKFLEKTIQVANNVVSIQPIRWLQDPTATYKKTTNYKKYENSISKHIKDLEIINADDSTKIFGANFIMQLGIYVCDKNTYENYDKIKWNKNGYDFSFIERVVKQIKDENGFAAQNIQKFNDYLHNFVPLNWMTGENLDRCKPTCCVKEWTKAYKDADEYRYDKSHKSGVARGKIENDPCAVFKTFDEAKNCFDSFTKTKFTRFYMSFLTTDIHIYHEFMPWMKDYTKPWTDDRFYEHFNITKDEQKIIEEYAENVYKRLNKAK